MPGRAPDGGVQTPRCSLQGDPGADPEVRTDPLRPPASLAAQVRSVPPVAVALVVGARPPALGFRPPGPCHWLLPACSRHCGRRLQGDSTPLREAKRGADRPPGPPGPVSQSPVHRSLTCVEGVGCRTALRGARANTWQAHSAQTPPTAHRTVSHPFHRRLRPQQVTRLMRPRRQRGPQVASLAFWLDTQGMEQTAGVAES